VAPDDQPGARPVLPQLRLDDLLTELQTRLATVLTTRDRVHGLLEAIVSIGGDLELETVLRRIIEAASTLVDARYGALGVIGEDDRLVQFITTGVTQEQIDALEHWPHGLGILGLLIKDPRPLRLADLTGHPESYGFPENHPPMRRFLGVPIRVRGEVFGNLYLTEKTDGEEFDDDDQNIVSALATAAGVAIENARLYQEARRRERWLEASAEVSTALLSGTETGDVLHLVVRRAREICDADVATVALAVADGLEVRAVDGDGPPLDDAAARRVHRTGDSLASPAGLVVPLAARGVLSVTGRRPFPAPVLRLLETFAAQAAIALELAERRRDTERLVVLEDRDRIAKDLHDTVIQRLFAIAMTLMSAIKITQKPDVASRVQRAVDDLDDTIRQIRSTIFALQSSGEDEATLRSRLLDVVDDGGESLGFAPGVRLDGLLDTVVDEETGDHLVAVLREALSNAARHAHATRVDVTVAAGPDDLLLRVADDGVGLPEGGRRSGLANLADRARRLGGTFSARPGDAGGTVLEWRVPL
jgi:two-component system, NarL family, sensor histidine kinase DevS